MKTLDSSRTEAATLTKTQQRRATTDRKIAKLDKGDNGRPVVKPVTVGSTTVSIITVINGNHWAFQVPFYPKGPGQRELKTFADPDDAKVFALTVANGKAEHLEVLKGLGPEQIGHIALIAELLVPFCAKMNIPLGNAIKEYIEAKGRAGEKSLVTCMKDYLSQPWLTKSQMPLPEVIKEFLRAKTMRNCKRNTLLKLYYVLGAFSRRIGGPPLAEVTQEQIEAEIFSKTREDRSNYTYYCELHGFFAWAKRNGYLRPDQLTAMDAVEPPLFDKKDPDIIHPDVALRILKMLKDPECVLYMALCLFSGGRADELVSVRGEHIAPSEFLTILAPDAKKRKDKKVKISDLLDQWLRPWYGRKGFLIRVACIQRRIKSAIENYNQALKDMGSPELPILWKHNWLRHSFSTYRVHITQDLNDTAEECDHEPETMAQYYLIRVSKAHASQYFCLSPEACGKADWAEIVKAHLALNPEVDERITLKKKHKPGVDEVSTPKGPAETTCAKA